ncbi:MAG: hypothetical protein AAFX06_16505 [Planctomycetota bacterium]
MKDYSFTVIAKGEHSLALSDALYELAPDATLAMRNGVLEILFDTQAHSLDDAIEYAKNAATRVGLTPTEVRIEMVAAE